MSGGEKITDPHHRYDWMSRAFGQGMGIHPQSLHTQLLMDGKLLYLRKTNSEWKPLKNGWDWKMIASFPIW